MKRSYLNIKLKVANSDGSNLADDAKTSLVNCSIASLFQQVDVLLNDKLISSSTNTYAYRAMLEVLLGYDHKTKITYVTMGLYSKDAETKMDLVAVASANSWLKARTQYIKESKIVQVSGLLDCHLVHLDCLLLNGLPLKIVLH